VTGEVSIGLFVGGAGKRMGGVAKGLLPAPAGSETIIERLLGVCRRAAPAATVYLVGNAAPYAALGLSALQDDPAQIGPLGGLRSLLLRARAEGSSAALALACDLPFLDERVISLLIAPLTGAARVPFSEGRLQPLAAAYAPGATLGAVNRSLALGKYALMHVLDQLAHEVERVAFDAASARALYDWDTPEDLHR
jgi:molybdopterin-guanine dinucleotide biosynthesis protein A